MERFIESLDIDQIIMIKGLIDDRYKVLTSMSRRHIKTELSCLSLDELHKMSIRYLTQQDDARNNKEYDALQLRIDIIQELKQ